MAGGWAQAARLPVFDALQWTEDHLQERRWKAHAQAMQLWATTVPAYVQGGTPPPDPPEPPED